MKIQDAAAPHFKCQLCQRASAWISGELTHAPQRAQSYALKAFIAHYVYPGVLSIFFWGEGINKYADKWMNYPEEWEPIWVGHPSYILLPHTPTRHTLLTSMYNAVNLCKQIQIQLSPLLLVIFWQHHSHCLVVSLDYELAPFTRLSCAHNSVLL